MCKLVKTNIAKAQAHQKKYYDLRRRQYQFKIGDKVMRKTHFLSHAGKRFAAGLAPRRERPYAVVRIPNLNVLTLKPGFHIGDFKAKRLRFAMRRRLEHLHFGDGDAPPPPARRGGLGAAGPEVHHGQNVWGRRHTRTQQSPPPGPPPAPGGGGVAIAKMEMLQSPPHRKTQPFRLKIADMETGLERVIPFLSDPENVLVVEEAEFLHDMAPCM